MLLIHHFKDLVAVCFRQDNRCRAVKIQHGKGIQRIEIGPQDCPIRWVHGLTEVQKLSNTSSTRPLGNLANVIFKNDLCLSDGVIGLGHRCDRSGCGLNRRLRAVLTRWMGMHAVGFAIEAGQQAST